MAKAAELQRLTDSLWLWQAYDRTVKADLFSSAVKIGNRLFCIDPISLNDESMSELIAGRQIGGVILTNANHVRSAELFARQLGVPVFGSTAALTGLDPAKAIAVGPDKEIAEGIDVLVIEGGPAGEIALHFSIEGGTLAVGDALINFEPSGFALLPAKYCLDQTRMRQSLRELLDWQFERMLFAHGMPILSSARTRLEALLNDR